MTPRKKVSVDVVGAGGVAAGAGGTEAMAAGADVVALVFGIGTAADLLLLGTLVKESVVDLPFFSSTSS